MLALLALAAAAQLPGMYSRDAPIVRLHDANSDRLFDSSRYVLVKVTDPGCRHCLLAAHTFEAIAKHFSSWPHKLRGVRSAVLLAHAEESISMMKVYPVNGTPTLMLLKDGHRVSVYKGRIRKDKVIAWVNAHTGPFGGRLGALWRKATGAAPEVRIPRPRDRVIPREFAQWVANSLSSGSPHQAAKALAAVGLLAAFVLAFVAFVVYAFVANAGASDVSAEAPDAERRDKRAVLDKLYGTS